MKCSGLGLSGVWVQKEVGVRAVAGEEIKAMLNCPGPPWGCSGQLLPPKYRLTGTNKRCILTTADTHIHIYIHTYINTYIHTYTCTHITHIHKHTHMHTHRDTYTYKHIHIHTHTKK